MKPFILFSFETGHVFEIPTKVIADDRAAYYLKSHPDEFKTIDESMADTVGLFEDSDYDIRDWFLNNMEPDEVIKHHGRLINFVAPKLDWGGASYVTTAAQVPVAELNGETILSTPVELVMSAMAQAGEYCSMQMLMNPETGQASSAIVFVNGGPKVVGAFASGLQQITNFVTEREQAAAAATNAEETTH